MEMVGGWCDHNDEEDEEKEDDDDDDDNDDDGDDDDVDECSQIFWKCRKCDVASLPRDFGISQNIILFFYRLFFRRDRNKYDDEDDYVNAEA